MGSCPVLCPVLELVCTSVGWLFGFFNKKNHHFRVFEKKQKKEPVSSGYFKNQNQRIGCTWVFEKHQNQRTSRFWVFEKPSTIEELCNPGYFKTLKKPLVFMKE
jgi:hypothetical protein